MILDFEGVPLSADSFDTTLREGDVIGFEVDENKLITFA